MDYRCRPVGSGVGSGEFGNPCTADGSIYIATPGEGRYTVHLLIGPGYYCTMKSFVSAAMKLN